MKSINPETEIFDGYSFYTMNHLIYSIKIGSKKDSNATKLFDGYTPYITFIYSMRQSYYEVSIKDKIIPSYRM